jgi:hypothetical protein
MDINQARQEGKCRHCGQIWAIGHMCDRKRAAQTAYQERSGGAHQREVKTNESAKAKLAQVLDAIELLKKELKYAGK